MTFNWKSFGNKENEEFQTRLPNGDMEVILKSHGKWYCPINGHLVYFETPDLAKTAVENFTRNVGGLIIQLLYYRWKIPIWMMHQLAERSKE